MRMDRFQQVETLRSDVISYLKELEPAWFQSNKVQEVVSSIRNQDFTRRQETAEPSSKLNFLSAKLGDFAAGGRSLALVQSVLRSLKYTEMYTRYTGITPPSSETFNWIFESRSDLHFSNWLKAKSGIF